MKPTEHKLDKLFAAARSEEPIITEEGVRDLLEQEDSQQKAGIIISRSFFTKKGITMISLLGASLAAIVAFNSLFISKTESLIKPTIQSQQPDIATVGEPKKTEEPVKRTDPSTRIEIKTQRKNLVPAIVRADRQTQPGPRFSIGAEITDSTEIQKNIEIPKDNPNSLAPMQVTGVNIITADPSQFPKLGVDLDESNEVGFYFQNGNDQYERFSIPNDTWGLKLRSDSKATSFPAPGALTPTLMTDTRGNKRWLYVKNDSQMFHMNHSHQMIGDSVFEDNISLFTNQQGGKKLNKGVVIRQTSDKEDMMNDSAMKQIHEQVAQQLEVLIGVLKINKMPHNDSTVFQPIEKLLKKYAPNQDIDKMMGEVRKLKDMPNKQISITIGADSEITNGTKVAIKNSVKQIQDVRIQMEDIQMGNLENSMPEIEINMAFPELSKLVPVLVRPATKTFAHPGEKTEYDNGVIVWYEQSPELQQLLSKTVPGGNQNAVAEQKQSTTNHIITSAAVFPNPAVGETTVRYTLSEPRTISFTIHNILGRRITDLGQAVNLGAGDHEQTISVASLPPGIYLLAITTDKGEQTIQRIVVEH